MKLDFPLPPAEVLADFDDIESVLTDDKSGDRARAMVRFFSKSEMDMRERALRTSDFAAKESATLLAEAFAVGKRVVAAGWANMHGRDLTV